MVQDESSSESCKALFFFRKINTPYIRGKAWECINPSEGQALMRRKEQKCCLAEVIPDETGSCPGFTSRHNRSTVGYRESGDACSKRARLFLFRSHNNV